MNERQKCWEKCALFSKITMIAKALPFFWVPVSLLAAISHSPGGTACSSHPCTIAVTCPGTSCAATDLQTAINEAWLGDTITVQAGVTWTIANPITLYRKTSGSGVLTIRTSTDDGQLPAPGTRITPAYKALLPELQMSAKNPVNVITIEQTSNAVEHYLFLGIWFSAAPGADTTRELVRLWSPEATPEVLRSITYASNTAPITLSMATTQGFANGDHVVVSGVTGNGGSGVSDVGANGWWMIDNVTPTTVDLVGSSSSVPYVKGGSILRLAQWDVSQTPNDITFDRCLFVTAPLSGVRQGARLAGRNLTIENSYCDQIKSQSDSQCVSMPSTPGPVTITNNYLGGGPGETIITGGAVPTLPNQYATDITITHNVLHKDPALYKYENWSPGMWVRQGKIINGGNGKNYIAVTSGTTGQSAPTFPLLACPSPPVCSGDCCVADGNVTWQVNWMAGSDKWTMKNLLEFKTGNRVTVKWNTLDGAWVDGQSGLALSIKAENQAGAYDWTAHTEHVEVGYNIIRNAGRFGIAISGGDNKDGVTSDINIHDNLSYAMKGGAGNYFLSTGGRNVAPPYFTGLRIVHNTMERAADASGFWSAGTGAAKYEAPVVTDNLFDISGNAYPLICFACPSTSSRKAALDNISASGYTFSNNVLAGENLFSWPRGNYNTSWRSIGFNNPDAGDYRLQSRSPYRGAGTDGKDLGADTTQLPAIEGLTITPTDRLAVMNWSVTAPMQDIPCVAEVSTERDFRTTIDDLDPARYVRPDSSDQDRLPKEGLARALIIGANSPLASETTYWYRLHCGGGFAQGSFRTLPNMAGTAEVYITRTDRGGAFTLEWGTSYSRATDTISGGGRTEANCAAQARGAVCSAKVVVAAGGAFYYRIIDSQGGPARPPVMVKATLSSISQGLVIR